MPEPTPTETPGEPEETPETPAEQDFAALYGGEEREAIREQARAELAKGADAGEQARTYAAKGKPDFTLAYLLAGALADDERRAIYAEAFERRAALTETKARDLDKQFHRAFPMLYSDAAQDRALARRVRAGRGFGPGAGKQLPMI